MRSRSTARRTLPIAVLLTIFLSAFASAGSGQRDPSFGGDGVVVKRQRAIEGTAIALGPSGEVVGAGSDRFGDYATVARYLPDGTPDPGFGDGGQVQLLEPPDIDAPDGSVPDLQVRGLDVDSAGRTLVLGEAGGDGGTTRQIAVIRLMENGDRDSSFGDGGTATIETVGAATALAIRVMSDGEITVAGSTGSGEPSAAYLGARLDANGEPDTAYGDHASGTALISAPPSTVATSAAIDRRGRTVVLGAPLRSSSELIRLGRGGVLDQSFSGDGRRPVDLGPRAYDLDEVAITAGRGIVVAGTSGAVDKPTNRSRGTNMAVAEYGVNGERDSRFSSDGRALIDISKYDDPWSVEPLDDGRLVVLGSSTNDAVVAEDYPTSFLSVRLTRRGKLDRSFGHQGSTRPGLSSFDAESVLQPHGKVLSISSRYEGFDDCGCEDDDPVGFQILRQRGSGSPADQ